MTSGHVIIVDLYFLFCSFGLVLVIDETINFGKWKKQIRAIYYFLQVRLMVWEFLACIRCHRRLIPNEKVYIFLCWGLACPGHSCVPCLVKKKKNNIFLKMFFIVSNHLSVFRNHFLFRWLCETFSHVCCSFRFWSKQSSECSWNWIWKLVFVFSICIPAFVFEHRFSPFTNK